METDATGNTFEKSKTPGSKAPQGDHRVISMRVIGDQEGEKAKKHTLS